jgi:hypothetical protein
MSRVAACPAPDRTCPEVPVLKYSEEKPFPISSVRSPSSVRFSASWKSTVDLDL